MEKTEMSVNERVEELVKRTEARNYTGREMNINLKIDKSSDGPVVCNGRMLMRVSETPKDSESWLEREYEVMFMDDNEEKAVALTFAYLNSIPQEYGDMIFENDFEEVLKLVEEADNDEAEQQKQEKTIH